MREAEASPNLSPPSRSAQTPMQMRPEATSPYKEMNVFRNILLSIRECTKRRARRGCHATQGCGDTSGDTSPRAIDCRTAEQRQGAAAWPESAMLLSAMIGMIIRFDAGIMGWATVWFVRGSGP
jgi:hypothetical protein